MAVHLRNKSNEALGLLLLALTVALYLALLSYNATDPSMNVSSSEAGIRNSIGRVGAWASDLLFQLVGLAALALPIPLLLIGVRKLRGHLIEYPYIKVAGFTLIVLAVSSGLTFFPIEVPFEANFTAGGILGIVLSHQLQTYLNWTGSLILLATVFLISLLLTTRFSVEGILKWLSSREWNLFGRFSSRLELWKAERQKRRELARIKKARRDVVTQPLPHKISLSERPTPERVADPPEVEEVEDLPPVQPVMAQARRTATAPSRSPAEREILPDQGVRPYLFPSIDFLQEPPAENEIEKDVLLEQAQKLATKCAEFDVSGRVLQIHPGPVVTTFEFKPDPGVKYSRITNLEDDLCLAMRAESVRIDRVPGKNTVGIEVPNESRRIILLREILAAAEFQDAGSKLTLALGQLINGTPFVADLTKMPHLLIAGATGAGKSVGLNCVVLSILYKARPDEVRFIMVDPKRLELGLYDSIPHLLTPIVTDPKKAANALNWAVREMEERYKLLAQHGVRNIAQFNQLVQTDQLRSQAQELERLPYIVILVDELADLMMTAGKDVEISVTRLAQMARAVGIHLILATQRPSVDVITGLIKANFPCRISFRVSSKIDSRTILDSNGAEQLLGMGDMLFLSPQTSRLIRIHGAYVSEKEICKVVEFLKLQGEPSFQEEILLSEEDLTEGGPIEVGEMDDKLYDEAARFVAESRKASTSLLQRRFRIGYGRAARLLDIMEHEGIVGPSEGSKPREVLVPPDYYREVEAAEDF